MTYLAKDYKTTDLTKKQNDFSYIFVKIVIQMSIKESKTKEQLLLVAPDSLNERSAKKCSQI